ncbi:hypothetical protein Tsubulata_015769 [Turnera subulata]|uniref:Uncharacterized protein n=1 Tax=Turnera subulata TaxID=218843 RepID=A0A9Q0JDR6_9ROSI|nr:hypothetical protein Tsubulata_015769 [Turnera subulata]
MGGTEQPNSPVSPSSLKQKLKSTFGLFVSFRSRNSPQPHHPRRPLRSHHHHHNHHHVAFSSTEKHHHHHPPHQGQEDGQLEAAAAATPSTLSPRENANANAVSSPRDKAKQFISRIGRRSHGHGHSHGHHRRHSLSADFRYDAMSYSLNFDEGMDEGECGEDPLRRTFSSRLPPSPTRDIQVSVS